jgi:hypothetical protein
MIEWQPIETAPKDGTVVLLWDGEYVTQGTHFGGMWLPHGECDFAGPNWLPTHWMPLPEPPRDVCPFCAAGDSPHTLAHEGKP